jgi:molybdopterin/thiamine biosynthesis adenylyltransferase
MKDFDYNSAFSRNIGWVTPNEQAIISNTVIAIPGMGGVGGQHLHALLRIGFQHFKIADLDTFEIQNFNRQFGATMSAIGHEKVEVLKKLALDINPNCKIEIWNQGINIDNMDQFLEGVDVVCDGLDLYASDLRSPLYELAHKNGLFVVSAGPFGMGTSLIAFHPKKMSFNKYFDLENKNLSLEAKIIRFLVGMSPNLLHRKYLAFPEAVDLFNRRLPSLHVGCYSASAALAATILKIVLKRGKVWYAPHGFQVDFYTLRFKKFWCPFGNRNFIQKIKIKVAHRMFSVKEFN